MAFSIIIPTWNNLPMLQLCVRSIRQHSAYPHEIVLHINEGSDGTAAWAASEGIKYSESPVNIGICQAVNVAFGLTTQPIIAYLNDDMYVLPDWDKPLAAAIADTKEQYWMFSSTMIEPCYSDSKLVINGDYGQSLEAFQEDRLLTEYRQLLHHDWSGASFPPFVISRQAWLAVGGFSVEFSPGMYSDPDLSMKLWLIGCRTFQGLSESRVYHFMARSTGRVKKNNGRIQFMSKWGIPTSYFYKHYLKMGEPYRGILSPPTEGVSFWMTRLKAGVLGFINTAKRLNI